MNETENIELDMRILNGNDRTYTSITDLYNVHIFTDADMQEFWTKKKEEDYYYNGINRIMFLEKKQKEELAIQDKLFLDEVSLSPKQEILDSASKLNEGVLFVVILTVVVFILGMVRYNIHRAIRRKKDANIGDFYQ